MLCKPLDFLFICGVDKFQLAASSVVGDRIPDYFNFKIEIPASVNNAKAKTVLNAYVTQVFVGVYKLHDIRNRNYHILILLLDDVKYSKRLSK